MKTIHLVVFFCAILLVTVAAWAQSVIPLSGSEKVEVAPTKNACCENAKDRGLAEANKQCHPGTVSNYNAGACTTTVNEEIKEYFDCTRSWTATCTMSETAQEQPSESDPCEGVSCSGHGSCVAVDNLAVCQCDPGYGPSPDTGQGCFPTEDFKKKLEDFLKDGAP